MIKFGSRTEIYIPLSLRATILVCPGEKVRGGATAVAHDLRDLDWFPSFEDAPHYYADFDETGPFVAAVGDSECAV
jgi:hypothetical protein